MQRIYVQFQDDALTAQENKQLKHYLKKWIIFFLSKIIPVANPDFDRRLQDVTNWCVEFDIESGIPQREIGLNEYGNVVVKMPDENNFGYWADSNMLLEDFKKRFKVVETTSDIFEEYWQY